MEDFLPKGGKEAEALNRCFAQAATQLTASWNGLNMSKLAPAPRSQNDRGDDRFRSSEPWNASEWYASVWKAAAPTRTSTTSDSEYSRAGKGWLDGPITSSLGAGVHPVRRDLSCTVLAFRAARARLAAHFGPMNHEPEITRTPDGAASAPSPTAGSSTNNDPHEFAHASFEDLPKLRLEASTGRYPYLCNSIWASTPEHLMAALAREDLASFAHPFDEASMSAHWLHEPIKAPLCVLRGAFGVHPLYGGMGAKTKDGAMNDAPGGLEATMHREAALHLRFALDMKQ